MSETGLHRAGNLRNRIQERAGIKRESLWHSTGFVWLVVFLVVVSYLCPANPTPAPSSHLLLRGPGAGRGKFGKWRTKGAGRAEPGRAGRAPVPGLDEPAPLLPARGNEARLGKERSALSASGSREAAAVPAAPAAPAGPGSAPPGATSGQRQRDRSPGAAASSGGKGGSWEPSHSAFPAPPKEAQALIPFKLSYFLSLYVHTYKNIHALYIYIVIYYCIIYRIRLATMIPSTA